MLYLRHAVGHKLKKTLSEVDAMPHWEFMAWLAFFDHQAKEKKKAFEKGRKR